MAQTIDKLQVEIEASAKGVSQVFSQIQSQLKTIQSVMKSINTSNLTKLSNASNVSINTSGVTKAQRDISSSVSKIQQSLAGLESYKNAALSGDSSSLTSFNRRVISIQSSIDVLKEKMSQVGVTQIETSAFTNLKTQSDELDSKLTELKTRMDDVLNGNTTMNNNQFDQLKEDIITTRTELDAINSEMQSMVLGGTAYVNADSLTTQLDSAKSEVDAFVSDVNSQKPSLDTSGITITLGDVISTAKKAASKLLELSSSAIKSGFSAVSSSLSKIKSTLSSIGSTASKTTSTGFSKILKYGFGIRSLYVLFRRLRTAIKDSFTELQTSGAFFETTNANVDALSDSLSTLKYQFGAAFEPIFNTIAPALQTLINYLVAVMNTISAFIAKLTGASTYSKAVVATSEIADNTGSAASSAEDLNKQLQGFDELNNLSGDDDSGSGGSGSSSSDDSTVTYVEESVESALSDFWNTLADYIEAGDWYMVGSTISDCLTDALNSINWDTVFSTVSNWGTNLAEFMNGLITEDLFSAIGTTIGNSIKTGLTFLNSFGTTFNWSNFGSSIAAGINSYVATNPLSLAVETFNTWANGILTTLSTAIDQIDWSQIASNIADAIGKFDAAGISDKLGTVANELANALYTLVSNKDTWSNLGTKISEGINSFFSSMNTVDSKTGKSGWSALGGSITSTITGIGDMLITALEDIEWEDVGQGIADFISGINWKDITFTFKNLLSALKDAVIKIIKGMNLSKEDLEGISVAIGAIAVTVLTISGLSLAASITKKVITDMIANAIMAKIGTSAGAAVSIGSIGSTIAQVGLVIAFTVASWKIGTMAYENATGKAAPSFGEIVSTLASDGAFGDLVNGIKLDLEGDASITWDLSSTLSALTGNSATMTVSQLNVSTKKVKVDVDTSTTDGAMTFTNQISFDTLTGSDFSEVGADIVKGVNTGAQNEINNNGDSVWRGMWNQFKVLVGASIMGVFDIHSPAGVMKPYGEYILLGIYEGFKEKISSFSEVITSLKNSIISWVSEKFKNFSISNYISGWGDITATISATLGTPINTLKSWGTSFVNNITNKWTNIKSTVEAVLGGDIEDNGISTFTSWSTIFTNFKTLWTGTTATFKANTGGQISRITDLSSWQTTFNNLKTAWTNKTASFTATVGGQISKYTDLNSWKTTITNLTGSWVSKAATFTASLGNNTTTQKIGDWKSAIAGLTGAWVSKSATYTASLDNNTTTQKLGDWKKAISDLTGAWVSKSAYFTADFDESLSTLESFANAIKSISSNWVGKSATFTLSANVDGGDIDSLANSLVTKIKSKLSGTVSMNFKAVALGGVLTSGGWKSIPQYASGSLNTGSLFFAGEKSGNPELVGHVNGRTEVLNKSQLASVMYASVGQAMRNFGSLASPPTFTASGYSANGITGASGLTSSDALIIEQNRLLERQNMLLEQIANKDTTISINDIFGAMQSANNDYYNRTGNSAFVF